MNTAKYRSPRKVDRKEVSLEKFCGDCEKNRENCGRDVAECLEEATLYKNFTRVQIK